MSQIYISIAEGSKPMNSVVREFEEDVLQKTFEQVIDEMINHQGDHLNNPYDKNEVEYLSPIKTTYERGKLNGHLDVSYESTIQNFPLSTSLQAKVGDLSDFFFEKEDFLDPTTNSYKKGNLFLKNQMQGGYK